MAVPQGLAPFQSRDFQVEGECMVYVKFGAHISGSITLPGGTRNLGNPFLGGLNNGVYTNLSELGLADDSVRVTPLFKHYDIHADDFGPDVPASVMWQLAELKVRMRLFHYDRTVLDICLAESMGGAAQTAQLTQGAGTNGGPLNGWPYFAGKLAPAGTMMDGGLLPILSSGCHFMSLNLTSQQLGLPWRLRAAYLPGGAIEFPMGARYRGVELEWRVIPYNPPTGTILQAQGTVITPGELVSSGAFLWDRQLDN